MVLKQDCLLVLRNATDTHRTERCTKTMEGLQDRMRAHAEEQGGSLTEQLDLRLGGMWIGPRELLTP